MILYLHGFASSGAAAKATVLREYVLRESTVTDKNVISPDLPVEPNGAKAVISEIIEGSTEEKIVFGSSLGGFYALHAAFKYGIPCVLINPAVMPHIALEDSVGMHRNFKTDEEFEFKREYLDQLEKIYGEIDFSKIKKADTAVLLAKDDALLNYRKTMIYLEGHIGFLLLEDDCGHEFSKFGETLPKVFEYFKNGW